MSTDYEALKATSFLEYAARKNAETEARAKAEGWLMYGLIPTDEEYAAQWENAYEYEREMAFSTLSDIYKEEYGTRAACPSFRRDTPLEVLDEEIREFYARREQGDRKVEAATSPEPLTDNPFARLLAGVELD